ncbi:hypothetical protein Gotri_008730, partial [Gossypium trilobum]|nr:hypothetical protein [Gossypium trilobum]
VVSSKDHSTTSTHRRVKEQILYPNQSDSYGWRSKKKAVGFWFADS